MTEGSKTPVSGTWSAQGVSGSLRGIHTLVDEPAAATVSLLGIGTLVLRERRLILWTVAVALVLALVYAIGFRKYRATSSFAPHITEAGGSQLAGLAAQFGLSLGSGGGESVDFYAALLESRALLSQAVQTVYAFPRNTQGGDTLRATLLDIYNPSGDTPAERVDRGVRRLASAVSVRRDPDAGIITLSVKAKWPALAEMVNRRLLELVNDFNLNKRQFQAKAERAFVESRMIDAGQELEAAENAVAGFLWANRRIDESPRLKADLARLQRRVDIDQQIYLTLSQGLETARLDEVRNTPVITVIDEPEGSSRKGGGLIVILFLGVTVGLLVGVVLVLGRSYVRREKVENPQEFGDFRGVLNEALGALRVRRKPSS